MYTEEDMEILDEQETSITSIVDIPTPAYLEAKERQETEELKKVFLKALTLRFQESEISSKGGRIIFHIRVFDVLEKRWTTDFLEERGWYVSFSHETEASGDRRWHNTVITIKPRKKEEVFFEPVEAT